MVYKLTILLYFDICTHQKVKNSKALQIEGKRDYWI